MSGRYAELHALSNFTFLRGASHPEELVKTAASLGYDALAITDECSMSGIVRAHSAAKEFGLRKLIIGAELRLRSGRKLVALAQNRTGYTSLCKVITSARRAAEKGHYELTRLALEDGLPDCLVLWVPDKRFTLDVEDHWIRETFRDRLWIAVELLADGRQREQLARLREEGRRLKLPLVAAGDVHMHCRARRILQDAVTAIRHATTIDNAGFSLYPNGERHLRALEVLQHTYPADLLDDMHNRVAIVGRRGNVEERNLVGAFLVVSACDLDRVTGIANVDKLDALDDPAGVDVEAGDDSFCKTHVRLSTGT